MIAPWAVGRADLMDITMREAPNSRPRASAIEMQVANGQEREGAEQQGQDPRYRPREQLGLDRQRSVSEIQRVFTCSSFLFSVFVFPLH